MTYKFSQALSQICHARFQTGLLPAFSGGENGACIRARSGVFTVVPVPEHFMKIKHDRIAQRLNQGQRATDHDAACHDIRDRERDGHVQYCEADGFDHVVKLQKGHSIFLS